MKKTMYLFCALAAAAFAVSCGSGKNASQLQGLEGRVTFMVGDVRLNGTPAAVGLPIKAGDTVVTGEKSAAVIQFAESSILEVKSRTSLNVEKLDKAEKDQIVLFQTEGQSFNKIIKGKAEYCVKSRTLVAAVRGTAFLFCVGADGDADVSLLHGSVQASNPLNGAQSAALEELSKISVSGQKLSSPSTLTKEEVSDLAAMDSIEYLPLKDLDVKAAPVLSDGQKKILTAESDSRSIQYLKGKYGKLSIITTVDGKTYIGSFRQTGGVLVVMTVYGKEQIPSSKVAKIAPYSK